nr:unnamed protein product [Digitaria exilis]
MRPRPNKYSLQHHVEEGVVGALDVVVVHLGLVVLELAPAPAGAGLPFPDQGLVRAADGGLGVVGGLARRSDEAAVGRRGAIDLHRARAELLLRVDQAAVDGEHPPVLATLATHRAGFPWLLLLLGDLCETCAAPEIYMPREEKGYGESAVGGRFLGGHGFVSGSATATWRPSL